MADMLGRVDTKDSKINREIALAIKREKAGSDYTVDGIAAEVGISVATLNRIFSKNPRDINITQITWLAGLLHTTPQALVEDAVKRAGGMGAIMAEAREAIAMSEAPDTTDDVAARRRAKQAEAAGMSTEDLEKAPSAATHDPELDSDEPDAP